MDTATTQLAFDWLASDDPDQRCQAILYLKAVRCLEAVPQITQSLYDDNPLVRQAAMWALGKLEIADPNLVPFMLDTLHDPDAYTRSLAANALGELGEVALEGLLAAWNNVRGNSSVRYLAATAMGKIGDPVVLPDLLVALETDPESNVRMGAALALGQIGHPDAVPALIERLSDLEAGSEAWWMVRVCDEAALALQRIGTPAALEVLEECKPLLLEALYDPDSLTRGYTAALLGRLRWPEAVPGLIGLLKDDARGVIFTVGHEAARALETIATPEALAAVEGWRQALADGEL